MTRTRTFRLGRCYAAAALALSACTAEAKRPPPGGDCVPSPGTPCSSQGGGGTSTAGGTADSSMNEDASSGASDAGGSCTLVPAANPACQPCLDTSCGPSCAACTGLCALIVSCTQACSMGNTACATDCENRYANGSTAFVDFANCVQSSCSACPAPLLGTVADL